MHFLGCALELLGGCVHAREPMPIYCIHRIVMFDFPSINLYGVRRETTLITGPAPPKYLSLDGSLRVCVCICDPFVFLAWRIVPLVYTSLHDSPEVSTCLYIISNLRTVNSLCHSCLPFCGQTPRHIMFSIFQETPFDTVDLKFIYFSFSYIITATTPTILALEWNDVDPNRVLTDEQLLLSTWYVQVK